MLGDIDKKLQINRHYVINLSRTWSKAFTDEKRTHVRTLQSVSDFCVGGAN